MGTRETVFRSLPPDLRADLRVYGTGQTEPSVVSRGVPVRLISGTLALGRFKVKVSHIRSLRLSVDSDRAFLGIGALNGMKFKLNWIE